MLNNYKSAVKRIQDDATLKESPREKIERLYLSYFNDFLTAAAFAKYYGLSERKANAVIITGRKLHVRRHRWQS